MSLIIETTANQLYRVEETGDADLAHVWHGIAVKHFKGGFVDKSNARRELIRKAGSRIVAEVTVKSVEPLEIVGTLSSSQRELPPRSGRYDAPIEDI